MPAGLGRGGRGGPPRPPRPGAAGAWPCGWAGACSGAPNTADPLIAAAVAAIMLFTNRRLNDNVGRWLLAYPTFQAMLVYRRVHFAHHRDEMGPDEPDTALYAGYPIPRDSWRRKLTRDGTGIRPVHHGALPVARGRGADITDRDHRAHLQPVELAGEPAAGHEQR